MSRKRRGKNIKHAKEIFTPPPPPVRRDQGPRIVISELHKKPNAKAFLEMREKLKDPEVWTNPDELKRVTDEVWRLRDKAMEESGELRSLIQSRSEDHKMKVKASAPEIADKTSKWQDSISTYSPGGMLDPMAYGAAMTAPRSGEFGGPPPDTIVWACPRCGNENTNFKALNRKQKKRILKRYSWLNKGDVKKGLRYCMPCTNTLGYDQPMKKMEYGKLLKLKEQASAASVEKRTVMTKDPDMRIRTPDEKRKSRKRVKEREEREKERGRRKR